MAVCLLLHHTWILREILVQRTWDPEFDAARCLVAIGTT
jgi:hypothetical protein